jgi:hypothetical protein
VRRALLAAAVLVALLALTLLLFLLPPVVHALLDLASAPTLLSVEPPTAYALSDALVRDLLFGGTFDAQLGGEVFLSAAERSHLVDVGVLFRALVLFGAGALALLSLLTVRRRRWVLPCVFLGVLQSVEERIKICRSARSNPITACCQENQHEGEPVSFSS